jgi:hypothetical protein
MLNLCVFIYSNHATKVYVIIVARDGQGLELWF